MTERAAHLINAVLPSVRQWVLTMPCRLRYQMARNHGLGRAVLRSYGCWSTSTGVGSSTAASTVGGTGLITVVQRANIVNRHRPHPRSPQNPSASVAAHKSGLPSDGGQLRSEGYRSLGR